MIPRFVAFLLNALFWIVVTIVVTGGADLGGTLAGRDWRLDATSTDIFVLVFLLLLALWVRAMGRAPRELAGLRAWERGFRTLYSASRGQLLAAGSVLLLLAVVVPQIRHLSFLTGKDLAIFGQAYWNTLQGEFLVSSVQGGMMLWGEHFNPIVLAVLPFYWLWPSPETLLLLQSLALVAGGVPLYALARHELGREVPSIVLTLAYLLYLPLRQINLFEFHPVAFAPPLILAAFYYLRTERVGRFLILCLLVGMTKETGPIAVGLLGASWFFLAGRRWVGAVVAVASVIWFYWNLAVVMPAFHPEGVANQLARYAYLGSSPGEMLRTLVTRPLFVLGENLSSRELFYPVKILAPVAFLPLLTPVGLLALPYVVINILEGSGIQVWLVHYQAELTAFVFIAAVFGAGKVLERRSDRWLAAVLTASTTLFFGTSDVYRLRQALPTADTRRVHAALEKLPAGARVSAQAAVAPHLTQRRWLRIFPETTDVDWVVVASGLDPWPVRPERFRRTVRRLRREGFTVEHESGETKVLRRTRDSRPRSGRRR